MIIKNFVIYPVFHQFETLSYLSNNIVAGINGRTMFIKFCNKETQTVMLKKKLIISERRFYINHMCWTCC